MQLADFDFGIQTNPRHSLKSVKILDGILIDGSGKLTTARVLSNDEQYSIWFANVLMLELIASAKVGTTTFDVTGIDVSFDGSNFVQWETFGTAVTVTANESYGGPILVKSLIGVQAIKLRVANVTADGSNHMVATANLRALARN